MDENVIEKLELLIESCDICECLDNLPSGEYEPCKYSHTLLKAIELIKKIDIKNKDMHNELCLKCGNYRNAYRRSCDGCRWKKEIK